MSAELKEIDNTVEDDIAAAMKEIENKEPADDTQADEPNPVEPQKPETEDKADAPPKERDETGKFKKKEQKAANEETQEPLTQATEPAKSAPQSWSAAAKSEFAKLPPIIQAEVTKRENDIHQAMTRHDGELRMGREMKDVITPYMPIITAEGGTPAKAVSELLNTAYVLRTGSPQQKAQMVRQIAQTYGVDLGQVQQAPQMDPAMQQILDRINGIENKFTQQMTLQEQQEHASIMSEVNAFAANPANVYFEQLKPVMAPLLASGQAKDIQEAYDKACWADPSIRSTLIAKQQADEQEKRKAEIAKKKQASGSVTGSPGVKTSSSTPNNNSIEDDIRAAMDDLL